MPYALPYLIPTHDTPPTSWVFYWGEKGLPLGWHSALERATFARKEQQSDQSELAITPLRGPRRRPRGNAAHREADPHGLHPPPQWGAARPGRKMTRAFIDARGVLWVEHPGPFGPGFVRPLRGFEAEGPIPRLSDEELVELFVRDGRCFGGDAEFNAMVEAVANL